MHINKTSSKAQNSVWHFSERNCEHSNVKQANFYHEIKNTPVSHP